MARGTAKRTSTAGDALRSELPPAGIPLISGDHLHFFCGRRPPGDIPLHRHEQLEISVLFEPAVCRVSWGKPQTSESMTMTGPAIMIVSPQEWHSCHWECEADVMVLHLERPLQRELQFSRKACTAAHPLTSRDRLIWEIASGLRRLCLENNPAESRALALAAKCVACRAIELIGAPVAAGAPTAASLDDDEFRRVEQHTTAHLGHPIHAVDLAKCVGYSTQHFNALFKARMGITFAAYLMQSRMAKAKALFMGGARIIKTVAESVGYYDAGNFTAKFREHFGVSPRHMISVVRAESAFRPRISSERP